MIKKILLLFLGGYIATNVFAQNTVSGNESIRQQQIWIDFYPHYYVNKKLEYYGDSGFRTIIGEQSWNRLYIRPSVKYHFSERWELHSGIGVFYIFNNGNVNQFEVTPWQGIKWNWIKSKRINIKHLLRLEERWSFLTDSWNGEFEFRLRYKLSGKIKLRNEKWAIPFYGEAFLPLTGEAQEIYQNKGRAGAGLSYKATKDWKIEFLFNWQRSKAGIDSEVGVSDYIYQIKIKKVWSKILRK